MVFLLIYLTTLLYFTIMLFAVPHGIAVLYLFKAVKYAICYLLHYPIFKCCNAVIHLVPGLFGSWLIVFKSLRGKINRNNSSRNKMPLNEWTGCVALYSFTHHLLCFRLEVHRRDEDQRCITSSDTPKKVLLRCTKASLQGL